jgi:hypothetical protein
MYIQVGKERVNLLVQHCGIWRCRDHGCNHQANRQGNVGRDRRAEGTHSTRELHVNRAKAHSLRQLRALREDEQAVEGRGEECFLSWSNVARGGVGGRGEK